MQETGPIQRGVSNCEFLNYWNRTVRFHVFVLYAKILFPAPEKDIDLECLRRARQGLPRSSTDEANAHESSPATQSDEDTAGPARNHLNKTSSSSKDVESNDDYEEEDHAGSHYSEEEDVAISQSLAALSYESRVREFGGQACARHQRVGRLWRR